MDHYSYNNEYLMQNGVPWFPVMGEVHYSRLAPCDWKETVLKMKAGGVQIVSTYVFWLHHEQTQGEICFQNHLNLHEFVQTVQDCGLKLFLRIGPWCHGEARNGGFPDWLMHKGWRLRENDENYLSAVQTFWKQLYGQVKGFMHRDGGCIIGVQIENEYGHVGGEGGDEHIRTLTRMAREIGFDAPLMTATGWGGAYVGDLLPVMGGYCDAPWDRSLHKLPPSGNYLFSMERNDLSIGSDFKPGEQVRFLYDRFPFLTAELGGGLQVTYNRRPAAHAKDIGAMSMVKMGSGANLLGYYMYCGGTNPKGKLYGLQETKASGGYCDLAELNYDFRAPIRQYGQVSETFKEIKLLAMFLKDFGEWLCLLKPVFPKDLPKSPANTQALRTCIRTDGQSGLLFINNYVRGEVMRAHPMVSLKVPIINGPQVTFPKMTINNGDYAFYPFNMMLGSAKLISALATPLCVLNQKTFVFYTDIDPQYRFENKSIPLLTLSREEAKNAYKLTLDKEYLAVSPVPLIQSGEEIYGYAHQDFTIKLYEDHRKVKEMPVVIPQKSAAKVNFQLISENVLMKEYLLTITDLDLAAENLLVIDYQGNIAEIFVDGQKVSDEFYRGDKWEVGLRQIGNPKEAVLRLYSLEEGAPVYLDEKVPFENGRMNRLNQIEVKTAYRVDIKGIISRSEASPTENRTHGPIPYDAHEKP